MSKIGDAPHIPPYFPGEGGRGVRNIQKIFQDLETVRKETNWEKAFTMLGKINHDIASLNGNPNFSANDLYQAQRLINGLRKSMDTVHAIPRSFDKTIVKIMKFLGREG